MIQRQLQDVIESRMFAGKAIILIGARQVGKSTLFKMILEKHDEPTLSLNCDEPEVIQMLSQINSAELKLLIGHHRIVVIDEAQRVENIGMVLKRITDNFSDVQLLVTGSSSFDLQNKLNEPLTGRKFEYHLSPFLQESCSNPRDCWVLSRRWKIDLFMGLILMSLIMQQMRRSCFIISPTVIFIKTYSI